MKQNKKTVMIIGCITTICTFIAAVLIGWNHMVKITKGPKNEKEIGYYQWNHDQMDSILGITTFTYHGDRYETADGGGDGTMSFGYLEASMKGRKPAFWLKETMNQTDKKIVKTISWWKAAAEPVYALSSNSGCDMACAGSINDAEIKSTKIVFNLKLYLATTYAHIATKQTVTATLTNTIMILFKKYS